MDLKVFGVTDVGLKREINQDSILVNKKLGLFIVADGMGGHKGGEVASAMAVQTIEEIVEQQMALPTKFSPKEVLILAVREASLRIHNKSNFENRELMGMGTTVVAAIFYRNVFYVANVGDSRAYLFRKPHLWQLTEDHSLVNEQVKAGIINEAEAAHFVGKNVITRSVGFELDVSPDIVERELHEGDLILMCSDGLSGLVPDERIAEICNKFKEEQISTECVKIAKQAGGDDNVSVICIKPAN